MLDDETCCNEDETDAPGTDGDWVRGLCGKGVFGSLVGKETRRNVGKVARRVLVCHRGSCVAIEGVLSPKSRPCSGQPGFTARQFSWSLCLYALSADASCPCPRHDLG